MALGGRRAGGWVLRALAAVVVLALGYLVLAPTGRYLVRAAWEETRILAARRPLEEVVADRGSAEATRRKLAVAAAARRFALDSLGLDVDGSFETFTKLERDTLVLVLSASPRDRLVPHTWWFPVVGRVPYKGFFDFSAAHRARDRMASDGYDTNLRPASAFSTLGFFDDPLLSTTLRQDSIDLVNTVIHELTHSTYYARGEAAFNESFASFVGARGAERFFRSRASAVAADLATARWEDEKTLGAFWLSLHATLDSAFEAHANDRGARLRERARIYREARAILVHELGPRLRTVSPRYTERVALNNAALLARRVYGTDLALFDSVHARLGGNLKHTVASIIAGARENEEDPWKPARALAAARAPK